MHTPRELAESHTELARREARRLGRGDEGLAECYLALVEAACEWDPDTAVPFEAWATFVIRRRTRRRLGDQRIIPIPWRVRARLAAVLDELDASGRSPLEPSSSYMDPVLVAAVNALSVQQITPGADMPAPDVAAELGTAELPEWAMRRYGYDGMGMKTVMEVAAMCGMDAATVLRLDATFLRDHGPGSSAAA